MKYRKKPVVIDAVQFFYNVKSEMQKKFDEIGIKQGKDCYFKDPLKGQESPGFLMIKTLEGEHLVSDGDYIIKGIAGEFYPIKEDIFHKTYERVEEE
jgi:hypothetical protein